MCTDGAGPLEMVLGSHIFSLESYNLQDQGLGQKKCKGPDQEIRHEAHAITPALRRLKQEDCCEFQVTYASGCDSVSK